MTNTQSADLAWAAGLFEGEGSANFTGVSPSLHLAMTDEEIVRRFQAVIGRGRICMPKRKRAHWKQAWWWSAAGQQVEEIVGRLWPHLGTRRREQIIRMLHRFDVYLAGQQQKRTRVCERCQGTFLSSFNKPKARWCRPCWATASWNERRVHVI